VHDVTQARDVVLRRCLQANDADRIDLVRLRRRQRSREDVAAIDPVEIGSGQVERGHHIRARVGGARRQSVWLERRGHGQQSDRHGR